LTGLNTGYVDKSLSNKQNQVQLKNLILEEFNLFYSTNKKTFEISGINTEMLTPVVNRYILGKLESINLYIDRLLDIKPSSNKEDKLFLHEIITTVGKEYISSLALLHFLLILTHQHVSDDKNCILTSVVVSMGSKIINKYFTVLKSRNTEFVSFSGWKEL